VNRGVARCFFTGLALRAFAIPADAEEPVVMLEHANHVGSGLKQELVAGITQADFLRPGNRANSVRIVVVTAFNEDNYWLNFNGYSAGKAVYTIPRGWTVEITFINPSPSPHSAVVVEREMVKKTQIGPPAFAGASVPNPVNGISTGKAVFSFAAETAGEYAIACGVPKHAAGGHWVGFNVSATAKRATLKLGDLAEREAK